MLFLKIRARRRAAGRSAGRALRIARLGWDPSGGAGVSDHARPSGRSGRRSARRAELAVHAPGPAGARRSSRAARSAAQGRTDLRRRTARRSADRVDGILYGDNPEQGLARGSAFLHPVLRFRLDFPTGLGDCEQPAAGRGQGAGRRRLHAPAAAWRSRRGATCAGDRAQQHAAAPASTPSTAARTTINGLDAFVGVYQGQIEGLGAVTMRAAHIVHNDNVYMVAGLAAPGASSRPTPPSSPASARSARCRRPKRRTSVPIAWICMSCVQATPGQSIAAAIGRRDQASDARRHEQCDAGAAAAAGERASRSWWVAKCVSRRGCDSAGPPADSPVARRRWRQSRSPCSRTSTSRCPTSASLARPTPESPPSWSCAPAEAARAGRKRAPRAALGAVLAHLAEPEARGAGGRRQRLLGARGHRRRADSRVDPSRAGSRGAPVRGASTITQQLAKNLYLVAVARSAAEAARADHRAAARGGAAEGADLRDLPERDRVGRWRSGVQTRRRAPISACPPPR